MSLAHLPWTNVHSSWLTADSLLGSKSCWICLRMLNERVMTTAWELNSEQIWINLVHSLTTDSTSFWSAPAVTSLIQGCALQRAEEQSNCQPKHGLFSFQSSTRGCKHVNSIKTTLLKQRDSADVRPMSVTQVAVKGGRDVAVYSPACTSQACWGSGKKAAIMCDRNFSEAFKALGFLL